MSDERATPQAHRRSRSVPAAGLRSLGAAVPRGPPVLRGGASLARRARRALARRVRLLRGARAVRGDDDAHGRRGLPHERRGLRSSNALVAWLDGTAVDDGTACEIGMFAQLVACGDPRYVGIVGIATDLRLERRRGARAPRPASG